MPTAEGLVGYGRLRPEFCFGEHNVVGDTSEGLQAVANEEGDSVPKVSTTAWLVDRRWRNVGDSSNNTNTTCTETFFPLVQCLFFFSPVSLCMSSMRD